MRARILLSLGLSFLLPLQAAHATHTGSTVLGIGSSHAINTDSAVPLEPLQWTAGVRVENTEFDSLTDAEIDAAIEVDDDADIHSVDSLVESALTASFGVTRNFTIGLKLPYVSRQGIREPEHGHGEEEEEHHDEGDSHEEEEHADEESGEIQHLGDSNGLGDLSLFGLLRFYHDQKTQSSLALLFGVKTPTGTTDEHARNDERFETELQPGSGSWDPFAGMALSRGIGESWAVNASTTYRLATEGAQKTDLGDAFSYNVGLVYRTPWGGSNSKFNLILELNGEWRDSVESSGAKDKNSGGHWLMLSPGVSFGSERWSAFAMVGLPVVDNPEGLQDKRDWRALIGLQYLR
jgi:hypothetical protein